MPLTIHTSAAANFDQKAEALISLIEEITAKAAPPSTFKSERPAPATIAQEDIGELEQMITNRQGRVVARFFYVDGRKYGLSIDNYSGVTGLGDALLKVRDVRSKLSIAFIESCLFRWLTSKFKQETMPASFISFLQTEAALHIQKTTAWTPIAQLEVEATFPVGNSIITPLNTLTLNQWGKSIDSRLGVDKQTMKEIFAKIKANFQGLAAVATTIEAEPQPSA